MGLRPDLPPYPNSWYAFALSEEIRPGKLLSRKFMGQEVVVFRTQSGKACAADAYCPHLGAHFGHGGMVRGELLQCPFHGFQFNGQGECVQTGYGTEVPPKAKLRVWPLRERNDLILVYYDSESRTPTWEVPEVDTRGWTPLLHRSFVLRDHPQETTENSVDLGHFAYVHGYRNLRTLREFEAEGPCLSTAYALARALKIFGIEVGQYDFEFETQIYGLGYSLVNVRVQKFRVVARLWVLATPIDSQHMTLRLALRMKPWDFPLGAALSTLMARMVMSGFVHDTSQDFPIWENKRYTDPPALARGDGPIGKFRQWVKQFYR